MAWTTTIKFLCSIFSGNLSVGSKDIIIPGRRKGLPEGTVGHTGHVLALAVSSDGLFLVSIVLVSIEGNRFIHVHC